METRQWDTSHGVRVWLAPLEGVEQEEWPVLFRQMDPQRQGRCRRYRRQADRERCVLADALARRALAQAAGVGEESVLLLGEKGKKPRPAGLDWEFSVSHSGSLVLCAVCQAPVGADIQRVRPVAPALLRRGEAWGYTGQTSADFCLWWTGQEAAGKRTGRGLSLSPLPAGLPMDSGFVHWQGADYAWSVCGEKCFTL